MAGFRDLFHLLYIVILCSENELIRKTFLHKVKLNHVVDLHPLQDILSNYYIPSSAISFISFSFVC